MTVSIGTSAPASIISPGDEGAPLPVLVDSHCHLTYPQLQEHLSSILARAKTAGVASLMSICTKLSEVPDIQKIVSDHDHIFGTVGVHPHEAEADLAAYGLDGIEAQLQAALTHPGIIGIGETGLDYYYAHSPKQTQQDVFERHLRVAAHTKCPLIIHTRDADDDTLSMLKAYEGRIQGIIHCFSGSARLAAEAVEMGFYIAASGIMTFKKSEELREIFRHVPLDKLLVETDSPYLAPVPHRGKTCEPAFVRDTAMMLAQVKAVSYDALARQTTDNFMRLFRLSSLSTKNCS